MPNTKNQFPNKFQRLIFQTQTLDSGNRDLLGIWYLGFRICLRFGTWDLEFVCDMVLGIWNLKRQKIDRFSAFSRAGGGTRTHTRFHPYRILSPARLPIPPLRRILYSSHISFKFTAPLKYCQITCTGMSASHVQYGIGEKIDI